jgi:hypothetical protein
MAKKDLTDEQMAMFEAILDRKALELGVPATELDKKIVEVEREKFLLTLEAAAKVKEKEEEDAKQRSARDEKAIQAAKEKAWGHDHMRPHPNENKA